MYWYIKLKDCNGKDIRITPNFIDMKKRHNIILRKLTRIQNYMCSIPEVGRKREKLEKIHHRTIMIIPRYWN